MIMNEGTNYL